MPGLLDRLSLRHSLPLIIVGLTTLVLALAVLFAYRDVRRSGQLAAEERLQRVVDQLASLAATSAGQRLALKQQAGREPALIRLLTHDSVSTDEILEAIAPLRAPSDSGLPIEVWDAGGNPVFRDLPAQFTETRGQRRLPATVPLGDVPAYGAFYESGAEVHYYSTSPVLVDNVPGGWLVQTRRIGNPSTAADLEHLIGRDSRVLFSYESDSLWITLAGQAVPAPVKHPPFDSTVVVQGPDRNPRLLRASRIAGTPWTVHIEMPVYQEPFGAGAFLRRMVLLGLVLVAAAAALAVLLVRRLTTPLRELAGASAAVATGDYSRRVSAATGGDELIRLADAYNTMAQQVAESHDALQIRLREAEQLANQLEASNVEAERAREAAQSADRAKSEFLATMSHEIRTPINAVVGFCDLLELEQTTEEKRSEYVGRTRRAARQLAALVNDVLDLARADAGQVRVQAHSSSAREAIDGALGLLEDEIRRRKLDIDVSVAPDLAYCADPQRVEQVLLNLLSNAVKFTGAGGHIMVRAGPAADGAAGPDRAGPMMQFEVEDTGIGIGDAYLERVFEPFFQEQTGYTREYGGTGLGLSISRRLARLMGGELSARSTKGRGSCFVLLLPAAESSRAVAAGG